MNRFSRRRPRLPIALFAAGLLLAGCDAPSDSPAPGSFREASGPPDAWLLTIDTVRADHLGCWGNPDGLSPTLDRLLRRGRIARHAFTPTPLTAPSHASILTGLEPPTHGVRDNGKYALAEAIPSLPTLLREYDFRTGGFVAAFPLESRFGFDQGFDFYDDELRESGGFTDHYAERPARDVRAAAPGVLEVAGGPHGPPRPGRLRRRGFVLGSTGLVVVPPDGHSSSIRKGGTLCSLSFNNPTIG